MTIGLGCMRLSTDAERDPVRGRQVIAAAIAAGVELLDTADAYALDDGERGHNERLIAAAIAEHGGARRVEVATKGGLVRPGGAWVADGRARHLAAAARASRDRLEIAALDLYLLHAVDPRTPLATSVRALARLRDDGVARRIGLSNVSLLQLEAALAIAPLDAVEVELSPWKLDALRGGLVAACTTRGIRVLAHRPLGGPAGVRRAAADPVLAALAARLVATPAEIILAWLRTLSPVVVPLPGATRVATATSAARAMTLVLDDDARTALAARFLAIRGAELGADPDATALPRPARPALPPRPGGQTSETRESDAIPSPVREVSAAAPSPVREVSAAAPSPAREASAATPSPVREPSAAAPSPAREVPAASGAPDGAQAGVEVVMVLGMPASGKSTLAADLAARGYLRLNRDELGGSLIDLARRLDRELAAGARRVVIDNTYPTRASRAPVIEVARRHGAGVRCVVLETSLEDAQANAVARILARHGRLLMPGAPGQPPGELARAGEIDPRAQFRFRRDHEPPRDDEGFAAIERVPFVRAAIPGGRPALLVELDGIVWHRRPRTPDQIALRDGARDALHAWSHTHVVAATTWQPGLDDASALQARVAELLGMPLHLAHCAHPAGPPVCWCRKPMPGLALALAHAHGLDLARSLHLGKGPADRGFAARAGLRYADIAAGWPAPDPDPS
jgi:aryl-alcohol dehydrogenase-like predicted oxidoreductase/predicted kinase/histidinol phosphatase-like enzyme